MKQNLFFFIGGKTNYSEVQFVLDCGKTLKETFLVNVIKREKLNSETYVFLPHSIYEEKETYEQLEGFKVIFLPSIGSSSGVFYRGSYEYIVLWMFLNMLELYMEHMETLKEMYVDIGMGLNVYVDALKEALRKIILFDNLMNLGKAKGRKFYILFSDPIMPDKDQPKRVHQKELELKAWFDSPIKGFKRETFRQLDLDNRCIEILKDYYHTYKSIRYNAPLAIYTFGYHTTEEITTTIKEVLNLFLEKYDPTRYEMEGDSIKYINMPEPETIKIATNTLLALALYYNISYVLNKNGVKKKEEVYLSELQQAFERVYEHYKLYVNCMLLNSDAERISKYNIDSKERYLGEAERPRFNRNPDFLNTRNFYAHSGFESNSVLVRKDQKGVLVKYSDDVRSRIREVIAGESMEVCRS